MESFIICVSLIFLGVIIILPFITIAHINSLRKEIRQMNEKINALLMMKTQPATPEKIAEAQPAMEVQPAEVFQETRDIPPKVYPMPEIRPSDEMIIESKGDTIRESRPEQTYPKPAIPEIKVTPAAVRDEPPVFPKTKEPDKRTILERFPATNWLSKIGIVTLVLGIGFFVKYAIDQNWINEIGRVGIGLLTGGIIIGIAHKLRTNYRIFSSVLAGGGISVFYITITLAFREYALFGQTPAFVLLIIITLFSVLLSLFYDRKELAVFSLLGGFASPLMVSTGLGSYVVLFSYIFILNTGMLFVSYQKQWRIIGTISFFLTYFFWGMWIYKQFNSYIDPKPYLNLTLFVSLFYIQFYLLALLDHFKSEKTLSAYQVLLILTNNMFAYITLLYIIDDYSLQLRGLITLSLAVTNAIVLVILYCNKQVDRNLIYLIIGTVLSFVSFAIPVQLNGHVITLFWAAETVILLWLWKKTRIEVFYIGFALILVLTLCSYFVDIVQLYSHTNVLPIVANRLFMTGAFVIGALVINRLLLKRKSNKTSVSNTLELFIIALAYIVPMIELDMQLAHYTDIHISGTTSFRFAALATFTTMYIAVLGIIYSKKISSKKYIFGLLYFSLILYAIFYAILVTNLRYDIFRSVEGTYPVSYFTVHVLALPAIACLIYLMVKNIKSMSKHSDWLGWLLTIIVVGILSVETDHIVVWISGNRMNYDRILHDVHTFGYPVLWGVIAMILMIWGLNRKEMLLRRIALVFFGLIIIKFYAYDVWNMSQFGRIISFVLLGVILLLVSFLQQKIRTLVKDNEKG